MLMLMRVMAGVEFFEIILGMLELRNSNKI